MLLSLLWGEEEGSESGIGDCPSSLVNFKTSTTGCTNLSVLREECNTVILCKVYVSTRDSNVLEVF